MLNQDLSTTMRSEVERVLSGIGNAKKQGECESNVFNIVLTFTSKLKSDFNIVLSREIKSLKITQDFVNNFTDKIVAELTLEKNVYRALYTYRQELFCEIDFTKIDPTKTQTITEPASSFFKYTYRAIPIDTADLFKQIPAGRIGPEDRPEADVNQQTFRMKVELIDEDVYVSRKRRFHGTFRNVTMQDMLVKSINYFGFGSAVICTPDNDNKYTNFVIPPCYSVFDIMSFLQNAPGMGVYNNGFCSYIMQNAWYVFPRFTDTPICKRAVHLYGVGEGNYEGLMRQHWVEGLSDGDITTHIIINGELREKNWSAIGAENLPNSASVQMDEVLVDNCRKLTKDGEFEMNTLVSNYAVMPTDPMSRTDNINIECLPSNCNLFTIKSNLMACQVTTLEFVWNYPDPFTFHPGTIVEFHYDHIDAMTTAIGTCEYVEYVFVNDKHPNYPVFTGVANVRVAFNNKATRDKDSY